MLGSFLACDLIVVARFVFRVSVPTNLDSFRYDPIQKKQECIYEQIALGMAGTKSSFDSLLTRFYLCLSNSSYTKVSASDFTSSTTIFPIHCFLGTLAAFIVIMLTFCIQTNKILWFKTKYITKENWIRNKKPHIFWDHHKADRWLLPAYRCWTINKKSHIFWDHQKAYKC